MKMYLEYRQTASRLVREIFSTENERCRAYELKTIPLQYEIAYCDEIQEKADRKEDT